MSRFLPFSENPGQDIVFRCEEAFDWRRFGWLFHNVYESRAEQKKGGVAGCICLADWVVGLMVTSFGPRCADVKSKVEIQSVA